MTTYRAFFNPVEWLAARGVDVGHITFDPDVEPEYRIRRTQRDDTTQIFTDWLIGDALTPLAQMTSYFKRTEPADWQRVKEVRYRVGLARIAAVYGDVDLPAGHFPGQRQRITVPVRCEYVMRDG